MSTQFGHKREYLFALSLALACGARVTTWGQGMKGVRVGAVVAVSLFLAGCANTGASGGGPVVVGGGLFTNAFSAPPVAQSEADAVLADLLATETGQSLSASDRRAAATALQGALAADRTGKSVSWENRSSGVVGRVVTGPSYQVNNILCRDYTHVLVIEERETSLRGAACRSGAGQWQPIT